MKKIRILLFSVMAILLLLTVKVCAAEPVLEILGNNEAKAEETVTLTVKLVSEEDIGVISGKISGNLNFSNLELAEKNNWGLQQEGSVIKLLKARCGKNEDVLTLTFTIKGQVGEKATITLSDLTVTTITYETKSIPNVTKEVTIVGETADNTPNEDETPKPEEPKPEVTLTSIAITKAPTKVKYEVGEKFSKDGMEITAKYSDGTSKKITNYTYTPEGALTENDKKVVISYKENNVTKTVEQSISVEKKKEESPNPDNNNPSNNNPSNNNNNNSNNEQKQNTITIGMQNNQNTQVDNTVANKELSKAGMDNVVFYTIIAISAIGFIFYIKYNKMKEF